VQPLRALVSAVLALLACVHAAHAIEPIDRPVIAVAGSPLLVAVRLESARDLQPVSAQLDDTTVIPARLFPIEFRAPAPNRSWVGPSALPVIREDRALNGVWLLRLDLPRAAAGQGVWINGERWALRWLADPVREATALGVDTTSASPERNPFASVVPRQIRSDARFKALAANAALSPLSSWRWTLLTEGLRPAPTPGPPERALDPDRVLTQLIRADAESRWRRALLTVFRVDRELSIRVRRALAGTVRFQGDAVFPVWWPDEGLLDDLLEAKNPTQVRERTEAWLEAIPPVLASIIDDAAGLDPSGDIDVRVRAVVTTPNLLALAPAGPSRACTLLDAVPTVAAEGVVALRAEDPGASVLVGVEETFYPRVMPLRARPPALVVGPLLAEPTLAEWRSGADAVPDTSALLVLQRGPGESGRWQLYVELTEPTDNRGSTLTIFVGPRGAADRITLTPDNAAARSPSGWATVAPLPIEPRAALAALAVVRERPSGARSSWPRPMLPWDEHPGRAPIDLTAWSGAQPAR